MFLYSPDKVYLLDKAAVKVDGFTEVELMGRAGRSVWSALRQRWPEAEKITVFAGSGNNGGDAFVVALCAREQGLDVQFIVQGDLSRQSDTSAHYAELWRQGGGEYETWQGQAISGDVIVDGLLGIGLERELDGAWQAMIQTINRQAVPRVAIDIPSGLNGLTGNPQPVAVEADLTVTFIGAKTGQYLADGPDFCGELLFEDLGVSDGARTGIEPRLHVVESCLLPPPRRKNTHKNHYGNLLIVGGDEGMSGAVTLAARAALRSGAGLVTALVHPDCRTNLAAFPEVMVSDWSALADKLPQASVVVVGPGLGDGTQAARLLEQLKKVSLPLVIDAGALKPDFLEAVESDQVLITPHPGEAASLLGSSNAEIQADRLDASQRLVEKYGATCVLKGSGSLIAAAGNLTAINTCGNPGMASAGMGDVLSGIAGALIGQGLPLFEAACSAVMIHALCADDFAADQDQAGLIAGDIIERIPRMLRQLRDSG